MATELRTPFARGLVAASLVVALLYAPAAFAENPCADGAGAATQQLAQSGSGLSGTGLEGGDDSGIGGTGLSGGDESGIGGTGLSGGDDSGIGGTGIYGTITAFGSICVNGLRVHYDSGTPVSLDGELVDPSFLAVGQVVGVDATGRGSELEAVQVSVHNLLVGPITDLDREAQAIQAIEVMGARVEVIDGGFEDASALALGTRVAVAGLWRSDGVVVASRLDEAGAAVPDAIAGIALVDERGRAHIGGVALDELTEGTEAGRRVRATGRFDLETNTFMATRTTPIELVSRDASRLSVEGYLHEVGGEGRLFLPGVEVERASLERSGPSFDGATRVRVTGQRDRSGLLRIERVQRVERPTFSRDVARDAARLEALERDARAGRTERPNETKKLRDTRKARPTRADRERPERPPRPPKPEPLQRPSKPDRPTVIDTNIRDRLTR